MAGRMVGQSCAALGRVRSDTDTGAGRAAGLGASAWLMTTDIASANPSSRAALALSNEMESSPYESITRPISPVRSSP